MIIGSFKVHVLSREAFLVKESTVMHISQILLHDVGAFQDSRKPISLCRTMWLHRQIQSHQDNSAFVDLTKAWDIISGTTKPMSYLKVSERT